MEKAFFGGSDGYFVGDYEGLSAAGNDFGAFWSMPHLLPSFRPSSAGRPHSFFSSSFTSRLSNSARMDRTSGSQDLDRPLRLAPADPGRDGAGFPCGAFFSGRGELDLFLQPLLLAMAVGAGTLAEGWRLVGAGRPG